MQYNVLAHMLMVGVTCIAISHAYVHVLLMNLGVCIAVARVLVDMSYKVQANLALRAGSDRRAYDDIKRRLDKQPDPSEHADQLRANADKASMERIAGKLNRIEQAILEADEQVCLTPCACLWTCSVIVCEHACMCTPNMCGSTCPLLLTRATISMCLRIGHFPLFMGRISWCSWNCGVSKGDLSALDFHGVVMTVVCFFARLKRLEWHSVIPLL